MQANEDRAAYYTHETHEALYAFLAEVDEEKANVNAWVDDKIEWAREFYHYDEYHLNHVIEELNKWRDNALAELDERAASANELAEECIQTLLDTFSAFEEDLWEHTAATLTAFSEFGAGIIAQVAADGQQIYDDFFSDAAQQNLRINNFLDDLVEKFEWWLKQDLEPVRPSGYIVLLD